MPGLRLGGAFRVCASRRVQLRPHVFFTIALQVGAVENYLIKNGCSFAFDAIALAACEAAGLGPENPLSEV